MYVSHLQLSDFRSYPGVELTLPRGRSALVGPNGQGKTNLVEAVNYAATLGSHRVASDPALVRLGAARAVVRVQVERDGRSLLVELEITPGKANRARVNRAPVPRPREVLGLLRTVLFAPEDLALVKGDPGDRRRFLDELLVARAPRLAGVRADYDRVLKQRNALLKSAGPRLRNGAGDLRTLEVWDTHLARVGAELLAARLDLVDALRPLADKSYAAIAGTGGEGPSGAGPADLEYRSSLAAGAGSGPGAGRAALADALLDAFAQVRKEELDRGVTLVGPHRDDLLLKLGPLPAKGYASHGESWSYALALRLAAYHLLRTDGGEPVLILDDVFAELDTDRRRRLSDLVADAEQVLVTAADPSDVPESIDGAWLHVQAGQVRRVR